MSTEVTQQVHNIASHISSFQPQNLGSELMQLPATSRNVVASTHAKPRFVHKCVSAPTLAGRQLTSALEYTSMSTTSPSHTLMSPTGRNPSLTLRRHVPILTTISTRFDCLLPRPWRWASSSLLSQPPSSASAALAPLRQRVPAHCPPVPPSLLSTRKATWLSQQPWVHADPCRLWPALGSSYLLPEYRNLVACNSPFCQVNRAVVNCGCIDLMASSATVIQRCRERTAVQTIQLVQFANRVCSATMINESFNFDCANWRRVSHSWPPCYGSRWPRSTAEERSHIAAWAKVVDESLR